MTTTRALRHPLEEGGLEVGRRTHVTAATRGSTGVGAVGSTLLRSVGAVLERVAELTAVAAVAYEDAGVHVGHAVGSGDAHAVAGHVDLSGDVDSRVRAEGELAPGVGDLTVDGLGVRVDTSPGTGLTVSERDGLRRAGSKVYGDIRLDGVHPGASATPDDEDHVSTGVVGEGVGPLSIAAQPNGTVVCLRVVTGLASQLGEGRADVDGKVVDSRGDRADNVGHSSNGVGVGVRVGAGSDRSSGLSLNSSGRGSSSRGGLNLSNGSWNVADRVEGR